MWDDSAGPDMRQEIDMAMLEDNFADIDGANNPDADGDLNDKDELDDDDLKGTSIESADV